MDIGLLLFSNSVVNDGSEMRAVPLEFAPDLKARSYPNVATDSAMSAGLLEPKLDHVPHILLATTGQLPSTARLAIELHDAGARVSLIAPSNHPGRTLDFLSHRVTYRALAPRTSLEAMLARTAPDLVIPCDERTVRDLHAIWRDTSNQAVKRLIGTSTAPAESFSTITSRAELLALARREGVRVPNFTSVTSLHDLQRWTAENLAPLVLKADGSWAGFGVQDHIGQSIDRWRLSADDAPCQWSASISRIAAGRQSLFYSVLVEAGTACDVDPGLCGWLAREYRRGLLAR